MQEFILINQEEVASILDMKTVIAAVEKAYSLKVSGQAELFPFRQIHGTISFSA